MMTLFDQETQTTYVYKDRNDAKRFSTQKNRFSIRFKQSSLQGSYPNYELDVYDAENHVQLHLYVTATSKPHWVAQESTNGFLPFGLSVYRYGFFPRGDIKGTLHIQNQTYTITGVGYFEHVWGDFSYRNMFMNGKGVFRSFSCYAKLLMTWLQNHRITLPNTIMFSSENNPLGYDWIWGVLENGWTFFYGNSLFWLTKGPAAGLFILSKNGETYEEYYSVDFSYPTLGHNKEFDCYYPTSFDVIVKNGKEQLHLRCTMTSEVSTNIFRFPHPTFWKGLVLFESPGHVEGVYSSNGQHQILRGVCKIEPQRQASILDHTHLKMFFVKPPKGVGVFVEFYSRVIGKQINGGLQVFPKIFCMFKIKRI